MSLERYWKNRWIRPHQTSADEIGRLLAIADRDIADSQTAGLSPEWRFDIAYNAMLQLATAALAASGFQAERQSKHLRTIETLTFTVGLEAHKVSLLDRCRRKRNTAVYEQIGMISDQEASEMTELAKELRRTLEAWLQRHHGRLLST